MRTLTFFDGFKTVDLILQPGETADQAAQCLASPTLLRVERAGWESNSPEVMAAVLKEIRRRRANQTLFERALDTAVSAKLLRRWQGRSAVEIGP